MSDQSDKKDLAEEVDRLERKIQSNGDSLRETYQYDVDDLVRLGEIAVTDEFAEGSHGTRARTLLDEIIETVSEEQVDELASRTVSQFTPATLYVTGIAIHNTGHFSSEVIDIIPEIVDVLYDNRSSSYVNQSLALLVLATAENDPNAIKPGIEELGVVLRREATRGISVPSAPALISTFETLSETSPSSLTGIVEELIEAAHSSNLAFRRRALITLRRIAETEPLAVRNSVRALEPMIESVVDKEDIDALIEICRILVLIQGKQADSLLETVEESSEDDRIIAIVGDARDTLNEEAVGEPSTMGDGTSQSTKSMSESKVSVDESPDSTAYQARLLASHLRLEGGEDCSEVLQWLHEMDDFLRTYHIDDTTVTELQDAIENNIYVLSERKDRSLTDTDRVNRIRRIANRFEGYYARK